MDYVLGGVAALITGNVTPNRPRTIKKALTPTKHQPSPNVTPKSELVNDRSIFLSPTLQKKKAIVKKSPKRIFQNPDMDTTENEDSTLVSPKADKVKKHLKDDLELVNRSVSIKLKSNDNNSPSKKTKINNTVENKLVNNENTPKKKKKNKDSFTIDNNKNQTESKCDNDNSTNKSPKKMKQRRKSPIDNVANDVNLNTTSELVNQKNINHVTSTIDNNYQQIIQDMDSKQNITKKKSKKRKHIEEVQADEINNTEENENLNVTNIEDRKEHPDENIMQQNSKKLQKKNKKRNKKQNATSDETICVETDQTKQDNKVQLDNIEGNLETLESKIPVEDIVNKDKKKKKSKKKAIVNPNAVTDKDSESEHGSDDEIESESEEINKKLLEKDPVESSSDEEEEKQSKQPVKKEVEKSENYVNDPNELKRTLFVGNVPFSKKCKKEIKKIFSKYGKIETVRIRTVPIKDARDTPKLAIIKNELHPDRSTVNVYLKFADEESIKKALIENNTILNDHHLRVSRSDSTGAQHDPRCSVFVGNLPFALEDEALRAKFENCGEIDSVRIIRDKKTNAGKGFGYVNFKSKDGVELALTLSEEDLTIKNRILRVKRCTQASQRQNNNRFNERGQRNLARDRGNHRQLGSFRGGARNESDGAYRRVMYKRKYQQDGGGEGGEGGEGPASKRLHSDPPRREKKSRKEFVGVTAEKRKKHKFDRGQKKKKILSEILTK